MKANVHPTWNPTAKVSCVCGNTFTTGSIRPEIRVEICSKCHPFYTGQHKLNDTKGQVEKFTKFKTVSEAKKQERAKILENRKAKVVEKQSDKPSLKDMLLQARKQTS